MMDDNELDALLKDAARGYNEPPATPREEMWTRIAATRATRATRVVPIARRWNAGRIATAAAGIAAVLLLGVMIGRWTTVDGGRSAVVAAGPDSGVQLATADDSTTPRRAAPDDRSTAAPQNRTTPRGRERPKTPAPDARRSPVGPEQSIDPQTAQKLYQLVALQHFGRSEQLLTAFRADVKRGAVDARIASWARDLLSTTRLLIDSPAAEDPQLRVLLGDLEVLLVKMAHLSGDSAATMNSKMIDDALSQGELMNRLRTAVPASVASEVQGEF